MHDRSSPRRKCWPGGATRRDGVGVACLVVAGCLAAGRVRLLGRQYVRRMYVGAEDSEDSGKRRAAEALSQSRHAGLVGSCGRHNAGDMHTVQTLHSTPFRWISGAGQSHASSCLASAGCS